LPFPTPLADLIREPSSRHGITPRETVPARRRQRGTLGTRVKHGHDVGGVVTVGSIRIRPRPDVSEVGAFSETDPPSPTPLADLIREPSSRHCITPRTTVPARRRQRGTLGTRVKHGHDVGGVAAVGSIRIRPRPDVSEVGRSARPIHPPPRRSRTWSAGPALGTASRRGKPCLLADVRAARWVPVSSTGTTSVGWRRLGQSGSGPGL